MDEKNTIKEYWPENANAAEASGGGESGDESGSVGSPPTLIVGE